MIFSALSRRVSQISQTVSLRTLLAALFVLQIVIGVGVAEWLSFENGQKAVNQIARQWLTEVSERVESNLQTFLATPHLVNQLSANTIVRENLDVRNLRTLETVLWENLLSFDAVNAIAFGNATGEYTALTRILSPEGQLNYTIERADVDTGGQLIRETIDAQEQLLERLTLASYYNTRQRPWYQAAIWAREPVWSPVFFEFNGNRVAPYIAAVQPVYRPDFTLQGVAAIFLNLHDINHFLQRLPFSQSGEIFILERTGELIGTSSEEDLLVTETRNTRRRLATESQSPLVQAVANTLNQEVGSLKTIQTLQQFHFKLRGDAVANHYFVQVTPFSDARGLDWLVVVAVPESDFLGPLQTYKQTAFQVALVAIAIAIIIGLLTARWITQPIQQLSEAALALPQGTRFIKLPSIRTIEVRRLVQAFNHMARQLQQSFAELEIRVEERTAQLRDANQLLTNEVLERQRSENILRSILEGTASFTGADFFRSLVSHLAASLDVQYAFITECVPENHQRVRTLAFWSRQDYGENFEYDLKGTPCDTVISDRACRFYPNNIQQSFPEDLDLVKLKAESYLGIPLIDRWGTIIGHLAVLDDRPMFDEVRRRSIIEIFAARAGAEMERQQAEDALRQSEAMNRSLLQAIPDLMMRVREDGIFLDFWPSKRLESVVLPTQVVGKSVFEVLPKSVAHARLAAVKRAIATGETQFHEYALEFPQEVRYEESRIVACGPDQALVIVRDITDREHAEAALRLSEEKYSKAFLSSPEYVTISTLANGRYIEANESFLQAFGYTRAEVIGSSAIDLGIWLNPEHRMQMRQLLESQGFLRNVEVSLCNQSGQILVVLLSAEIIEIGSEACVLAVMKDITERKQAEVALQQFAQRETLLNRLASAIRNSLDLEMILETAVHEIHDLLGCDRAFFAWLRLDELQPSWDVVKEAKRPDLSSFIGCYPLNHTTAFPQRLLKRISSNLGILRVDDMTRMPDSVAQQFYLNLGFQALLSVAMQTRSGEIGTIGFVQCTHPRIWSSNEVELLQAVADQLAIAISQAELYKQARLAQIQSERLLRNILPEPIAERLKKEQQIIADSFEEVTVLFSDIVGFTQLSSRVSPVDLVEFLNNIFSSFDRLTEKHGLEKIKTIGDAYMVVGGLPKASTNHAEAVAEMALDMQRTIEQFKQDNGDPFLIRIGINTGPVTAGVIGLKKFIYDLWGDTVNVASRMESQALPGSIQVTETTYERLKDRYLFERRGTLQVKGKGEMVTYLLLGKLERRRFH